MPVELVAAAVLATGYMGVISLEVFNNSLNVAADKVPSEHAMRGMRGLKKVLEVVKHIPAFWQASEEVSTADLVQAYQSNRPSKSSI